MLRRAVEPLFATCRDQGCAGGHRRRTGTAREEAFAGADVNGFIHGGEQRADSVRAGLDAIEGDVVLVHDAARPFCPPEVIDRLLARLEFVEGAAPVLGVGDTLARAGDQLGEPVDRTGLVRIQTPQAFRLAELRQAYSIWSGDPPTDETSVMRAAGMAVAAVDGDPSLEKLTTPADWARAEALLAAPHGAAHRPWLRRPRVCRRGSGDARRYRRPPFPRTRRP